MAAPDEPLTLRTGQREMRRIKHCLKKLDAKSMATAAQMLAMSMHLEQGFDDIMQRMKERKEEMLEELLEIADEESQLILKEKEALQQRMGELQKALKDIAPRTPSESDTHRICSPLMHPTCNSEKFTISRISCSAVTPETGSLHNSDDGDVNVLCILSNVEHQCNEKVSASSPLAANNTLSITWKLEGELGDIGMNPSPSHKVSIECAYLPFTCKLSESDIHRRVQGEFLNIFEMDLPAEEVFALCDGNASVAEIDGPQQHHLIIVRLKYSIDGGETWSEYSNLHSLRYSPRLELTFDPNRAGHCLQFGSDGQFSGRTVGCTKHDDLFHTALFGIPVTSEMTSIFRIKFKVHRVALKKKNSDFFIGFASKSAMETYDQALGCGSNKSCSTGIRISGHCMFLHDRLHSKVEIAYTPDRKGYGAGDTFRWTFNFKKKFWTLYHDNKIVLRQKLRSRLIVPGVTLGNHGECVGVVSWKFEDHE